MGITVNTNMQAIRIQGKLNAATNRMNTAMERMSSGYKINKSKDDAAGYAVSATLNKNISGSKIALDNVSMGQDLLATTEGSLGVIQSNLERIRDLTEQAANGTYSSEDLKGIASEITARLAQINSQALSTSFNGKHLLDGTQSPGVYIQVGTEAYDSTAAVTDPAYHNMLILPGSIFSKIDLSSGATNLSNLASTIYTAGTPTSPVAVSAMLTKVDAAVTDIIGRISDVGAYQNRLEAISDGLSVQKESMISALSTVKDADIAEESATYVQQQILQSASATLLSQANSAPQIALSLIQGQ